MESLRLLSQAGVVHHDLELRKHCFRVRKNPERAKIIDFGRAEFSEDRGRLQAQVEALKSMLGIASSGHLRVGMDGKPTELVKTNALPTTYES